MEVGQRNGGRESIGWVYVYVCSGALVGFMSAGNIGNRKVLAISEARTYVCSGRSMEAEERERNGAYVVRVKVG